MFSNVTLPLLIVFSLDHVLWPFRVDFDVTPPFTKDSSEEIVDANGQKIQCYEDVPKIFEKLTKAEVKIGVASMTEDKKRTESLLRLFKWDKYFSFVEIEERHKVDEFERIHRHSGIKYSEMLFFDDGYGNIHDVSQLGVYGLVVQNGVTMNLLHNAIELFHARKLKKTKNGHTLIEDE